MFKPANMVPYVLFYLRTLLLQVELWRNFQHVRFVAYEDMSARTFATLAEFLHTDL